MAPSDAQDRREDEPEDQASHQRAQALRAVLSAGVPTSHVPSWEREAFRVLAAGNASLTPGWSTMNADGAPFEVCLSASDRGVRQRLLLDPGYAIPDFAERFAHARRCVLHTSLSALTPALTMLMHHMGPVPGEDARTSPGGLVWMATVPDTPAIATYIDMARFPRGEAWHRVRTWLLDAVPSSESVTSAVDALSAVGTAASVGIEGSGTHDARAKVYWRLHVGTSLSSIGRGWYAQPQLSTFLARIYDGRTVHLQGLLLGVGFSLSTGEIVDVKADVCGCVRCAHRTASDWRSFLHALGEELHLDSAAFTTAVEDTHVRVAYLGLGIELHGKTRLNLYLKPAPGPTWRRARGSSVQASPAGALGAAEHAAVAALLRAQQADGSFVDYQLPVGRSDAWMTAYVGRALAEVGTQDARAGARRAADWLRRRSVAQWGFHGGTGQDADTIAHVLLLFVALGHELPDDALAWLDARWIKGEGFATYNRADAWGRGHLCVTGPVSLALLGANRLARKDEVVQLLLDTQRADGGWPAYWWKSGLYAEFVVREFLERCGVPAPFPEKRVIHFETAFELACLVGIEASRGDGNVARTLAEELARRQRTDGTFPPGALLRVTDPGCAAPWDDPRGPLYVDEEALLTTATALRALVRMQRYVASRDAPRGTVQIDDDPHPS